MVLDKKGMLDIVRKQLAVDMNCDPRDFLHDGVVFTKAALLEGRRLIQRQTPHLEIATMGKGIVVSGDDSVLEKVRPILENKRRDDLFSAPFLYGHSLYYIPDGPDVKELPCPEGFALVSAEGAQIHKLYTVPGFENAIQYDPNHPRPDVLVLYALRGNEIAGMAGASADCKTMWQIGIDVKEPYRGCGLAACLVSRLAAMIMQRGIVPFYGTSSSNIASQAVAHRSGFSPAWMCNYKYIDHAEAKTMTTFLEELSSKSPAPGGGGASALVGSIGVSLCAMVANLTTGKKKYAPYQEDLDRILSDSAVSAGILLKLVDKDAEVFEPLSKAYGIPKDEPGRNEILEQALTAACSVPMDILREASSAVDMLEQLSVKGSRLALSDVGVAATALRASMEGAAMNVYINTKLMKNRDHAHNINGDAQALLNEGVNRCNVIYEHIANELRDMQCAD